jgi:hypothetical protein
MAGIMPIFWPLLCLYMAGILHIFLLYSDLPEYMAGIMPIF